MFYDFIEKALNKVLQLNPYQTLCLQRLQGKCIVLGLTFPITHLCLNFNAETVSIDNHYPETCDLTMQGTPLDFIRMQTNPSKTNIERLTITGDFSLAQDLNLLFSLANIDWEEGLSRQVGDIAAHQLGQLLCRQNAYKAALRETFQQNTREYLQEEWAVVPATAEADHFYQAIDTLKDDVERLVISLKTPSNA